MKTQKDYMDGKCITNAAEFRNSTAEWFIVYTGMRTLQEREQIEKWSDDVLAYRTSHGHLFEAEAARNPLPSGMGSRAARISGWQSNYTEW